MFSFVFCTTFRTETSSQDSGEFSMSTDNDLSLTDYEASSQAAVEVGVSEYSAVLNLVTVFWFKLFFFSEPQSQKVDLLQPRFSF